jgi:hypothetical protein
MFQFTILLQLCLSSTIRNLNNEIMQHSIGYVNGDFYGARATLNVWAPQLEGQGEFSLAQMWITSDGYHYQDDRNTLEAGWQAS